MSIPMRTQPQGPIRLGQSSLARRLVSYLPLSGYVRDAVGGAWAITNGTTPLTFGSAPRGQGMRAVSSSTPSYVSRLQPAAIGNSTAQPMTLRYRLFIALMPVNGIPSGIVQWADAVSTGSPRFYVRMVGNAGVGTGTGFLEAYIGSAYRFQAPIQAGVEYIVTHTFDGTTHSLYLNGVLAGTPAVTPWDNTTGSFYLGRGYNDTTGQHILSDFALWSECLSAADVRADARNPWAMFDAGSGSSAYQAAIASGAPAPTSVSAAITWAEAGDAASIAGLLTNRIAAVWSEAGDTAALGAVITNRAASTWTEGDDSAAAVGIVTDRGALTWTEQGDSVSLTGSAASPAPAGFTAALSWTEAGDSASIVARLTSQAALAITEQGDTWALTAFAVQPAVVKMTVRFDTLPRNFNLKTIHFSN